MLESLLEFFKNLHNKRKGYRMVKDKDKGESMVAEEIIREWQQLSEEERERLLPNLIVRMRNWHEWTINPSAFLAWLELNFRKADVPFPEQIRLPMRLKHNKTRLGRALSYKE